VLREPFCAAKRRETKNRTAKEELIMNTNDLNKLRASLAFAEQQAAAAEAEVPHFVEQARVARARADAIAAELSAAEALVAPAAKERKSS
jgi:hypothetical protein